MDGTLTSLPDEGRYFGLENFGTNDYCNCILQALYVCTPFRETILQYAQSIENRSNHEDNICTCLADLFSQIHNHRKKSGIISPKRFLEVFRRGNDQFCQSASQDAHEFLVHLLLNISEILEKEQKSDQVKPHSHKANVLSGSLTQAHNQSDTNVKEQESERTWLQRIFEGKLIRETKCLQCETMIISREEVFMDLQLPVKHNSSLTYSLKQFSAKTVLDKQDKCFCEVCQCHQEAYCQNKIKQLPQILICHLMRFDDRMRKLMDRVVFPMELKLCNTTDDAPSSDHMYNLVAIVVHSGSSINHGHYCSLVKSHGHWLLFDDDHVEVASESWIERTFGTPGKSSRITERGYILFYEKSRQHWISNRLPAKGFVFNGTSRNQESTNVSQSETYPKLESCESKHPSSSLKKEARGGQLTEVDSLLLTPEATKLSRSRKAFITTLKSLWNALKVKDSRTTNATNGNSTPYASLN